MGWLRWRGRVVRRVYAVSIARENPWEAYDKCVDE